jgi:hypothetical protein
MPTSDARPDASTGFLARHAWAVTAVLLFAALGGPFVTRKLSEWDSVYLVAARHLSAGEDLFDLKDGYLYPPFMALVAVPFTALPHATGRLVWYLVNVACIIVLVRAAWRLSGGGAIPSASRTDRREGVIFAIGLAVGGYYLFDALSHQQTDALIACCVLTGALALSREQVMRGAVLLGLAAGAKCTALLWAPFLVWKGRGRAAGILVAVAVGVNLLPNLVSTPPGGGAWLAEWGRRCLAPLGRADACPGTWGSDILYNQSLAGAVNRWSRTELVETPNDLAYAARPAPPPVTPLKLALYGVEFALLAGVAGLTRLKRTDGLSATTPTVSAWEASLVCLLMLLLSPMSSKPHFILVLLPGFCLARRAVLDWVWTAAVPLAVAVLLGLASNKDLVGARAYTLLLWGGSVTVATAALTAGCAAALWRCPRAAAPSPALTKPARAA